MIRRPSDHSAEEDGNETSLQRLAFANSTRVRAGTFSTANTTNSGGESPLPSAVDVPSSRNSPNSPISDMAASPSRPGIETDPDVPDYSSDLSDEETDATSKTVEKSEYPAYHSVTVTEQEDSAQYARYDLDGDFEDYDESKPELPPARIWSSPSYSANPLSPNSPTFSIRSHREARNLVQQVQREILANAQVGARDLSEQLAAYGETLAIERRFAIGERQRFKTPAGEDLALLNGISTAAEQEADINERVTLRARERSREDRVKSMRDDQAMGSSLERSGSQSSLQRSATTPRPKPRPLKNKRPHTSSGISSNLGMSGIVGFYLSVSNGFDRFACR